MDRLVLVVAQPLPEFMSLRNLIKISQAALIAAAMVVVFVAPISIVLLTWCCLGVEQPSVHLLVILHTLLGYTVGAQFDLSQY